MGIKQGYCPKPVLFLNSHVRHAGHIRNIRATIPVSIDLKIFSGSGSDSPESFGVGHEAIMSAGFRALKSFGECVTNF